MKVKRVQTEIDLNDEQNEAILLAKIKADQIAEWGRLFHKGSLVVIVFSLFVAIFGTTEQWLAMFIYWLILIIISTLLMKRARNILMEAIVKQIVEDE